MKRNPEKFDVGLVSDVVDVVVFAGLDCSRCLFPEARPAVFLCRPRREMDELSYDQPVEVGCGGFRV